eukprot:COSAG06_NODE_8052_length_2287_cov_12.388026_3_plen_49_part_00
MTPAMIAEHELRELFGAVDVDGSGGTATYLPTYLLGLLDLLGLFCASE